MADNKPQKRLSLIVQIGLIFFLAVFVAIAVTAVATRGYLLRSVADQTDDVAKAAATAAAVSLGSREGFYRLYEDEEFREKTRKTFHFICEKTGLEYLYLYTINEEGNRSFLVSASGDTVRNKKIDREYGFGHIQKVDELYDAEKDSLNGSADGGFEFVNDEYGRICVYCLPMMDGDQVLGLIGAVYDIEHIVEVTYDFLKILSVIGFLVFGIMSLVMLLLLRRAVFYPIGELSHSMRNYTHEGITGLKQKKKKRLFDNEITDIEESFERMTEDIARYVSDVEALTLKETENKTYLKVATRIQEGIVPREQTLCGDSYEIFGTACPAKEVGGDFYELFPLDDHRICIIIGDVSGKGVTAALFMVMVKTTIREQFRAGYEPSEALMRANRELCLSNPEGMFATVFAAVFDTRTGVLSYANAGHNPPMLFGESFSCLDCDPGMLLGLFEDAVIVQGSFTPGINDGLFFYTDGVTEAINNKKEQFGEAALADVIRRTGQENTCGAEELCKAVGAAIQDHVGDAERFDDITCVALIRREKDNVEETLTMDIASFAAVRKTLFHSLGESERARNIILACEEIFANIVNYSGADSVSFSCRRSTNQYLVTFSDNGIPFDPVQAKLKKKEFEELDTGGMGIMLARMHSDDMLYHREDGRNELTLVFQI